MTPKQYWQHYLDSDRPRIESMCKAAGTTFANFQQIAMAGGAVGRALAKRLQSASDEEMTVLEILYPEDYEENTAA